MSDHCTCSVDPQITCIIHPQQETAMSDEKELDRCRAVLLRAQTKCESQKHIIANLTAKLAAAESDATAERDIANEALATTEDGE